MSVNSPRQLELTREKLRTLERMLAAAREETDGDANVREAELDSLQRQMNKLKEEIARFETHQPARR